MRRFATTVPIGPLALALLCLAALVSSGGAPAQPKKLPEGKAPPKVKSGPLALGQRIRALLNDTLDMRNFQQPMTLMEALGEIQKLLNEQYKDEDALPILVDAEAFKEENPDAPDVYDTQIKFAPFPRRMSVASVLRVALSKVPTHDAVFLVRRGMVEITTKRLAAPGRLLDEPVLGRFDKRPLDEALAELSEQTGASVILDPRLGDKAKAPVSATFHNTATLEAAVELLVDMAGAQVRRTGGDVLFVTDKPNKAGARPDGALHFRNVPLDRALRELAEWSGTTMVLDPYTEPDGPQEGGPKEAFVKRPITKTLVSATFQPKTEARAAAKILAALAGLQAVDVGNAVFVTARGAGFGFAGPVSPFGLLAPAAPKK